MLRQIIFIAVCEFWVQERHERRIAVFQPWSAKRPQSKDGTKLMQYISAILKYHTVTNKSRDSTVSIVTGLPAGRPRYRGSVPGSDKKWSPFVQEHSGIHGCFFLKGSRPSVASTQPSVQYLPEVKRLGHEVDLSPHLA